MAVRKQFQIQTSVCLWVTLTQKHRPQTTNLAFSLHYTPWRSHSHKFEMILISTRMHWTGKTTPHVLVPWRARTHPHTYTLADPPLHSFCLTWLQEISALHSWPAFRISSTRSHSVACECRLMDMHCGEAVKLCVSEGSEVKPHAYHNTGPESGL